MLLQNVQFTGPLGALVALIILFTLIVAALKGGQWLWQSVGRKLVDRLNRVRVANCEREMLEFWKDFFNHRKYLVMILNDKRECIYISTGLAREWNTSPHLVEGRKWRRLHKESTLDGYLAKLREAGESQSPFVHPVVIIPNGHEAQYLARGEPYIAKKDLRYFVITMDRMEMPKQLEA